MQIFSRPYLNNLNFGCSESNCSKNNGNSKEFLNPIKKGQEASSACLDLNKVRKLDVLNLRILGDETISGGTFARRPDADLSVLKSSGIKNIVDFRSEAEASFNDKCGKLGLKYFAFPLDGVINFSNGNYFIHKSDQKLVVKPNFVEKLQKYFDVVNSGSSYIGCHYGIDRTNIGVLLNYLLNPGANAITPEIKTWPGDSKKSVLNKLLKVVNKIYKRLDETQKEQLKINNGYDSEIKTKIVKVLVKNIYK